MVNYPTQRQGNDVIEEIERIIEEKYPELPTSNISRSLIKLVRTLEKDPEMKQVYSELLAHYQSGINIGIPLDWDQFTIIEHPSLWTEDTQPLPLPAHLCPLLSTNLQQRSSNRDFMIKFWDMMSYWAGAVNPPRIFIIEDARQKMSGQFVYGERKSKTEASEA